LTIDLQAGGTTLRLLPQRALFLPEHDTLLVADAHLGKAVSFRRQGVPVPGGTTRDTLQRLSAALAACGARRLIFLGDLLHSSHAHAAGTRAAVARWREEHRDLALTLVRGNHDAHAGDPPADWGVNCVDGPLRLGGLALAHHPEPVEGAYVLAGHVHPAALIGGRARDSLRLPCFHFGAQVGVLPAFGDFTGMHVLPRGPGDRVYVIAGDAVRALGTAAGPAPALDSAA
jgi:DNA ligase-associated metallophosphoesterase